MGVPRITGDKYTLGAGGGRLSDSSDCASGRRFANSVNRWRGGIIRFEREGDCV